MQKRSPLHFPPCARPVKCTELWNRADLSPARRSSQRFSSFQIALHPVWQAPDAHTFMAGKNTFGWEHRGDTAETKKKKSYMGQMPAEQQTGRNYRTHSEFFSIAKLRMSVNYPVQGPSAVPLTEKSIGGPSHRQFQTTTSHRHCNRDTQRRPQPQWILLSLTFCPLEKSKCWLDQYRECQRDYLLGLRGFCYKMF